MDASAGTPKKTYRNGGRISLRTDEQNAIPFRLSCLYPRKHLIDHLLRRPSEEVELCRKRRGRGATLVLSARLKRNVLSPHGHERGQELITINHCHAPVAISDTKRKE